MSAQYGVYVSEVLEKIINEKVYREDYRNITMRLLNEEVDYDMAITALVKIAKSKIFDFDKNIEYYNINAEEFVERTVSIDLKATQVRFLNKLPPGASILDFGCGSGRDTKYFLTHGYRVEATDGSSELCRLASEYTGIRVRQQLFHDLAEREKYDGIWACSSIRHVPFNELADVLQKMVIALKDDGIIYISFKYGTYEGIRNGRFFTDMTEDTFADLQKRVAHIETEDQWITSDARPGRGEEKWLNLILRKK